MIQYPSTYRLQAKERDICASVTTIINLVLHSLLFIGEIIIFAYFSFNANIGGILYFSLLVPMGWAIVDCIVCYHGLAYPSNGQRIYLIVSMAIHGVIYIQVIVYSIILGSQGFNMELWIPILVYAILDSGMYALMISLYLYNYTSPTSGQRIIYAPVKHFQNPEEMKIYSPNDNKL